MKSIAGMVMVIVALVMFILVEGKTPASKAYNNAQCAVYGHNTCQEK